MSLSSSPISTFSGLMKNILAWLGKASATVFDFGFGISGFEILNLQSAICSLKLTMHTSFLRISGALNLNIFAHPLKIIFSQQSVKSKAFHAFFRWDGEVI
jgi:hypothetical protein